MRTTRPFRAIRFADPLARKVYRGMPEWATVLSRSPSFPLFRDHGAP
jgi:hypothetical protein